MVNAARRQKVLAPFAPLSLSELSAHSISVLANQKWPPRCAATSAGCDLVMLSKFGKLEADGGGLRNAFGAAIEAGVPVLTSVSSAYTAKWEAFATPLFTVLPPDAAQVDSWWQSVRLPSHRPSSAGAAAYL